MSVRSDLWTESSGKPATHWRAPDQKRDVQLGFFRVALCRPIEDVGLREVPIAEFRYYRALLE